MFADNCLSKKGGRQMMPELACLGLLSNSTTLNPSYGARHVMLQPPQGHWRGWRDTVLTAPSFSGLSGLVLSSST